jgi:hypothetical protein
MKLRRLVAALLVLAPAGACRAPPPKFAEHTCGDGPRVVRMPLGCLEPADVLADQPDHPAAIHAALRKLGARTSGRQGEIIAGLVEEYRRLDAALRAQYVAACQGWTTPCDPSQEAAFQKTLSDLRAHNGRLRNLRASVETLVQRVQLVEPTDEEAKAVISQLAAASEELAKATGL